MKTPSRAKREIYLLLSERLDPAGLEHIDSQKEPWRWTAGQIKTTIQTITAVHRHFAPADVRARYPDIALFQPWEALPLYRKLVSIMYKEAEEIAYRAEFEAMLGYVEELRADFEALELPLTVVHNDFNSRNIAMRKNRMPCIFDWELAVVQIPHRDIVEFLSFTLPENFTQEELFEYLRCHYEAWNDPGISFEKWMAGYRYSLKEYLVTRISFYEVAGILAKYAFADRVREAAFRMLRML